MEEAKTNAEDAHKEITEAQSHQKSTNKWLCYILTVLAVVSVIIIIIVVAKA
jgi:type IV secretory pathway component VirB8